MKPETISAVKCVVCGKLHEMGGNSYVKVAGDIYIGENGGLIGPNFAKESDPPILEHSTIFCIGSCFMSAVTAALGNPRITKGSELFWDK